MLARLYRCDGRWYVRAGAHAVGTYRTRRAAFRALVAYNRPLAAADKP